MSLEGPVSGLPSHSQDRPAPLSFHNPRKYQRLGAIPTERRVPVRVATKWSLKNICALLVGLCAKFKPCLLMAGQKSYKTPYCVCPTCNWDRRHFSLLCATLGPYCWSQLVINRLIAGVGLVINRLIARVGLSLGHIKSL